MPDALQSIEELTGQYAKACKNAQKRFEAWETKRPQIIQRLNTIAEAMEAAGHYFRGHLTVAEAPVFSQKEDKLYKATMLTSAMLKSDNRTVLRFHTEKGGEKPLKLAELGFEVHFAPQLNGAIQVFCLPPFMPHQAQSQARPRQLIEVISQPGSIDEKTIDEAVLKAMQLSQKTSYLFQAVPLMEEEKHEIGFRLELDDAQPADLD